MPRRKKVESESDSDNERQEGGKVKTTKKRTLPPALKKWIETVKAYAAKHKITYGEAMRKCGKAKK